ncbi:MAG: EamA family transporter RarD [Pseudomonadota bacterium]|jgi:chloramphenicol-sensitive protein RarD
MKSQDTSRGFAFALSAYLLWGFLPFFMKALSHIPPSEVIAHRVVWSVPIAVLVLALRGELVGLWPMLKQPRVLAMGAATAALISVNWGIYVWAIGAGHALDAALGYYINPLFSVFLGAVLLKEKLSPRQMAAIGLAAVAVALLTWEAGKLPLVALGLTVTWGFYAYLKRRLPLGANQGFMLEILIMTPFALGYMIWMGTQGSGHFGAGSLADTVLLLACGLVTAVPLMLYANGAKGLRLSTIGILQYIAPTMILIIAIVAFKEPFGSAQMLAFPMIWAALALYTSALMRKS